VPKPQDQLSPYERDVDRRLGQVIRQAREAADIRQAELGLRLGVPDAGQAQRLVSRIEAGTQRLLVGRLALLATALGTSMLELLWRADLVDRDQPPLDAALSMDVSLTVDQRQAIAQIINTFRAQPRAGITAGRRSLAEIIADIPGLSDQHRAMLLATAKVMQQEAAGETAAPAEVTVPPAPRRAKSGSASPRR